MVRGRRLFIVDYDRLVRLALSLLQPDIAFVIADDDRLVWLVVADEDGLV